MGHPATWEGGLSPTLESVRAHTVRRWCGVPPWRPRAAGGRAGGRGRATAAPRQLAGGSGGSGSSRVGHGGSGGATGRPLQLRRLSGGARGRASWRSCTFFLQTAISKRRDHADLPGKPGPGNRMNVQRRPSCTFILSPDAPPGRETVGTTPLTPPGPQDECATRPHATSRHHDLPPDGDHPRPHTACTPPELRSKHPAPRPLQDDTTSRYPDKEADPDGPPPTPPPQTGPLP